MTFLQCTFQQKKWENHICLDKTHYCNYIIRLTEETMETVHICFNFLLKVLWNSCEIIIVLLPFFMLAGVLQFISMLLRKYSFRIAGEKLWTILAAPGTVLHEASHALFCLIFRHKIKEMKLFAPDGKGTLGYVDHSWDKRSFYQCAGNFFIGIAPVVTGTAVICLITFIFYPAAHRSIGNEEFHCLADVLVQALKLCWRMVRNVADPENFFRWQSWVHLILILLTGSQITLSAADFKGVKAGVAALAAGIVLISFVLSFRYVPAELLIRFCGKFMTVSCALMLFAAVWLALITGFMLLISKMQKH